MIALVRDRVHQLLKQADLSRHVGDRQHPRERSSTHAATRHSKPKWLLESGAVGRAAVPSGASTGEFEAVELRDGDKKRYLGKGVLERCAQRSRARSAPEILSAWKSSDQTGLDRIMIGSTAPPTSRRSAPMRCSRVSLAAARAAAQEAGLPLYRYLGGTHATLLPVPLMNILNGGAHAANNVDLRSS